MKINLGSDTHTHTSWPYTTVKIMQYRSIMTLYPVESDCFLYTGLEPQWNNESKTHEAGKSQSKVSEKHPVEVLLLPDRVCKSRYPRVNHEGIDVDGNRHHPSNWIKFENNICRGYRSIIGSFRPRNFVCLISEQSLSLLAPITSLKESNNAVEDNDKDSEIAQNSESHLHSHLLSEVKDRQGHHYQGKEKEGKVVRIEATTIR